MTTQPDRAALTAEQIVECYAEGQSLAEIGDRLGVTEARVYQIIKAHTGMTARQVRLSRGWFNTQVPGEVADQIAAVAAADRTVRAESIAEAFAVPLSTVRDVLHVRGLARDTSVFDDAQRAAIADAYTSGRMNTVQLAAKYGVSDKAIRNALDRAGVPRRGRGPSRSDADLLARAAEAYRAHGAVRAAAKALGTHPRRLSALLDQAGVPRRRVRSDVEVLPALVAAYRRHGAVNAAAAEAGVTRTRAKRILSAEANLLPLA